MLLISLQPTITILMWLHLQVTQLSNTSTLWDTPAKTSCASYFLGIIHRSNIDYAERIWEEFVQSLQTFLTDRKNLATASREKKKITHLFIPNVRFTKLIIHHLKTKHNIHPRTGSPLHYSHNENILNTLRFVGKDGREIFGMSIPDALLTDEIKGAPYYGEYQEHMAKYQQYLDAEHGKAEEGGAIESLKDTKVTKPKAAKATKPAGDKASMLTSTQPPKPKLTPTQPSKAVPQKKQKLVKKTSNEPSPAKRSKRGLVGKIRKPRSPLKFVDEPSVEDVLVEEPAYNEEEANLQLALELSLKEQAERTQGPARSVVIREPDSGRIQSLPVVQGKGKEKRRTPMLIEAYEHTESPSLDAKLALTDSETKSDNVASKIDNGDQDEGQAGPNPVDHDEGQAGSNPGDAVESQPQSSHVVHDGPNREHMDLEANDSSTQQNPEQMDEDFTTTAYPNVQENLKMPSEDPVILEEPTSSTETLSSLQNLKKELSFTYQFFMEKQQEEEPRKTNAESEI
uniref:E-beta-farnesene synthase n=1 Tax=Tanacetum cinerariifolium TaxID=118510 RepID=A0A699JGK1_TANCI|nr:hypothetical protein [Tanacetum cinerariifolium]